MHRDGAIAYTLGLADGAEPSLLTPPEPREAFALAMNDGAVIRVRRYGDANGPRIIMSHGNGFAIDAYYPFWKLFLDRYDVFLYDLRNHGRNPLHTLACHDTPEFVTDLESVWCGVEDRAGARPTAGIFHSISAVTSIRHAVEIGWRWGALVAVDPPLIPSPGHALHELALGLELGLRDWALRRPQRFGDPAELEAILRRSRSRQRWIEGAHGLMARSTLREDTDERDWVLACPGAYESKIYASNAETFLCPRLAEVEGPIKYIGADPHAADAWSPAIVNHALHEELGHPYVYIEDSSHMIHVERPVELAREVELFFKECGFV